MNEVGVQVKQPCRRTCAPIGCLEEELRDLVRAEALTREEDVGHTASLLYLELGKCELGEFRRILYHRWVQRGWYGSPDEGARGWQGCIAHGRNGQRRRLEDG